MPPRGSYAYYADNVSGLKGPKEINKAAIKAVNCSGPLPHRGKLRNNFSSTSMDHHDQGHGNNQGQGLQSNHRQTDESATTNVPSASFLSFEGQVYNTQHTPWDMDVVWRPYFQPTNELQGTSRASQRRLLTFPKGQAHPQAILDPYAWQEPLEGYYGTGLSVPLGLLPAEDQLDARFAPLNAPTNLNTLSESNVQTSQAHILYSGDVDRVYGRGNANAEPTPGHILAVDVPNVISTSSRCGGIPSGPINFLDSTMNSDPHGTWANPLLHHDNTDVLKGWTNRGDSPACDVIDVNIMSLRRRGVRSPPQKNEKDLLKLFLRLMSEGANIRAAVILRDVIFVAGVTRDALMAPIQEREMSIEYGGATRMWQLLLETREVAPGKKKFFCLLCPVSSCRGWNHSRDTVRHFNRDHFGFTFSCEHW